MRHDRRIYILETKRMQYMGIGSLQDMQLHIRSLVQKEAKYPSHELFTSSIIH